jgi:hypothetical protein
MSDPDMGGCCALLPSGHHGERQWIFNHSRFARLRSEPLASALMRSLS